MATSPYRQGFSLVELLMTLLLTSTGLLGLAALQGKAIRHTLMATQHQSAILLAQDLLEQLRADAANAPAYHFERLPASDVALDDCQASGSPLTIAQRIACWALDVENKLAAARALEHEFHLCHSSQSGLCNGGSSLELQLAWQPAGNGCALPGEQPTATCRYRLRTEP
ncbi:type IV pilus modification protein PilV [Pseudomonas sp. ABC1]|uniref:type IV pilus modification protein PilV n=1 Tax=Pseudomonas sp. ABC1 TaxID=2748080 RepID=UPI0015C39870|nr:type IV pilus modification protein PilV [Pseudomonas sp. ABC1]QLF92763.1 type IV pilus modification protein PilV [Pseudomonas sp. ABC1]